MSWNIGSGTIHNIGRQANETVTGLVSGAGEKFLYVGASPYHSEIFRYQDAFVEVPCIATRYGNYQDHELANDGLAFTDTWTVNLRETMIAAKPGVVLSTDLLERIKSNISSALLSHALWPSSYGRPDLPAQSVIFVSVK